MSFFDNIKKILHGSPSSDRENISEPIVEIPRIYKEFSGSYRIGILCYHEGYDTQEEISNYKKKLEQLGYECDVIMFIDSKEKENNIYLPYFDWNDLDKKTFQPHSPKTDRIIVKKYDILFNLFFQNCKPLQYIAQMSQARCRVGPNIENTKKVSDILVPSIENNIPSLISNINTTLKLKPYERKQI